MSRLARTAAALLLVLAALASPGSRAAQWRPVPPVVGRWDLTINAPGAALPSWLEVTQSGRATLVGRFVGVSGSVRPVSRVFANGESVRFSLPPQWERGGRDLQFEATLRNGRLRGWMTGADGRRLSWTAVRAPALRRTREPVWGEPLALFNGRDLAGWRPRDPKPSHGWAAQNGMLRNRRPGNDLLTTQELMDFRLLAEFRYPPRSKSGIYLRGRYEVQIEDNFGQHPEEHQIGSIYGFLLPRVNVARRAGEWQAFEITLVGRRVTVVLNGETILDRQEIPGITGGALDSAEGEPGPILIQGDHGPIDFRRLVLTPAR